jgi:multidrug transporter EmrE-like cation transporter
LIEMIDSRNLFGAFLAGLGAVFLALSMSVQRYAMVTSPPIFYFFGITIGQCSGWFLGLVIYWIANILFAISLLYAPLALLSAIWTTLLVWNLLFGWWFLNEKCTIIKAIGITVIMTGVSLIGVGTPSGIPTTYTSDEIELFTNSKRGLTYLTFLTVLVTLSLIEIGVFESRYPLDIDEDCHKALRDTIINRHSLTVLDQVMPIPDSPVWLNNVMGVVYPGSLGMDEAIGHLSLKALMVLVENCFTGGDCGSTILWAMFAIWAITSLATLWWLRAVYRRYDVTLALPIEYGTVMLCDAITSIVFFQEDAYMDTWQLITTISGVALILIGILLGRIRCTEVHYLNLN